MSRTYRGSATPGQGGVVSTTASDISIVDLAGHYTAEDVEAALAEIGVALNTTAPATYVNVTGDTMTGDLTVPNLITAGNVDGRDVSVDGATLDAHVANTSNPHSVTAAQAGALATANNLSDLADAATARTNLDVYSTSEVDTQAIVFAIALG